MDFEKFNKSEFIFPSVDIPVPELKDFFQEDEAPVWKVKSVTGSELAIINEAVATYNKTKAIIEAIATDSNSELKSGLKAYLNKSDDATPEDLIRRHKLLQFGTVGGCPEEAVIRLANYKPTTFFKLTNEIIRLTGDGASLGE